MSSSSKLILGLGLGLVLGTAVGYVLASDKKEEWLEQANILADKMKNNVKSAISRGCSGVEDLREDIDDIATVAKHELSK